MSEISPSQAAKLAEEIYTVQNDRLFKAFVKNPLFSQDINQKSKLTASIGGRIIRSATDGFGLCAMGGGRFSGDAFLIFRGTTTAHNKADFITDARIGTQIAKTGGSVHIGFNEVFKSMLREIRSFIESNEITGTIHCVGHSLGGAVATLAADWVKSATSRTVKLYTFGQPRVGFTMFSWKLTTKLRAENIHRVFHSTDPVPMVPIFPYVHSPMPGDGHFISSDQLIVSGEAHKMANYIKSVRSTSWDSIRRQAPVFNHEQAIKEWLTSKIRPDAEHPRTWEWLDAALIYVLTKIMGTTVSVLSTAIMGVHTLADRIAWILRKGIDLAEKTGRLVKLFIKKVMEMLGMPPLRKDEPVTQSFLTRLLSTLMRRAHNLARKALRL